MSRALGGPVRSVAVRDRLVREFLRHAEQSAHPSHQLLDRVERSLHSRDAAEDYADLLLEKTASAHPSLRMLDRAERMVRRIELSQALDDLRSDNTNNDGETKRTKKESR